MSMWTCRDGTGEWTEDARDRRDLERRIRRSSDVYRGDRTAMVSVHYRSVTGRSEGEISIVVPPMVPKCGRSKVHAWVRRGMHGGTNGGIRIVDWCRRCDVERVTETRGQDGATGETIPGGTIHYRGRADR